MKSALPYIFVFILFISCNNEPKLHFEPLSYESETCASCPAVSITIPNAFGKTKISEAINIALQEELIYLLSFDDTMEVTSIEDALKSFKKGYLELQQLYDDEATIWEAKIEGSLSYEDENFVTIILDSYIYTGGAHGYTSKRLLNFDKIKNTEIENEQLFKNPENFLVYAEQTFRQNENIPSDKPINHTGFMFEQDSFHLPENIGFTENGLILVYNPYEVSSFAEGIIELILPHQEVEKYLSKTPKS